MFRYLTMSTLDIIARSKQEHVAVVGNNASLTRRHNSYTGGYERRVWNKHDGNKDERKVTILGYNYN